MASELNKLLDAIKASHDAQQGVNKSLSARIVQLEQQLKNNQQ